MFAAPEMPIHGKLVDQALLDAHLGQVLLALRLVEQADHLHRDLVVDRHHHVGVLDVVDPRHVLVADALDAVRAEAVAEQGRALQRLGGGQLALGEQLLQLVARIDRAGRAGGEHRARQPLARPQFLLEHFLERAAGHGVVPQHVAELFELVEDHQVLARAAQFPALVEDFLDVAFGARGRDDLARDLRQPLEAFLAHAFGQDRDRLAAHQRRVVRAAAAVVAGRGPDGLLSRRVELAGDQPRARGSRMPHRPCVRRSGTTCPTITMMRASTPVSALGSSR